MKEAIPEWFSRRPSSRCSPRPPSTSLAPASWRAASWTSRSWTATARPSSPPPDRAGGWSGRPGAAPWSKNDSPAWSPAAEQLPDGLVLDGELVVWDTAAGRLSFEALQRRAAARGRTATALAAKTPAFFIAFDAWRSSSQPTH
ncbi:hypothetical protein [Streptomyces sp. CJ_13]|uniref:hypothetical protein n=1 Tax=Streptomyces sp. CJ_13 TaxID=2724943 RepID=UPI002029D24A|nr:hypothetical protein [Streptomyces sp. CJ_13]